MVKIFVIYDLGRDTSDATIIWELSGKINVIADEGNIDSGGENIDEPLRFLVYNINVNHPLIQERAESYQIWWKDEG